MQDILDFIRAAAPWVAMGVCVIVLCARGAARRKGALRRDNYSPEGMSLGMCFGLCLGTSIGDHSGLGIALGMLVGLTIGSCIPKKPEDKNK